MEGAGAIHSHEPAPAIGGMNSVSSAKSQPRSH